MIASLLSAALPVRGIPTDGQLGLQEAATPIMELVTSFNLLLLVIITAIALIVLGLLLWALIRYNSKVNKTPAKFSHNTLVEVIWTAVPVIILVVIAIPSFQLLYYQDRIPEADITVKATGYQWYWEYEYMDEDVIVTSLMLPEEHATEQRPYLFATWDGVDPANHGALVVPAGATVVMQTTAADVIHSWTVPAFGIKKDSIPGRLNQTWFRVEEPGIYFGQCSELCGKDHAYMPIEVHVLPPEQYAAWMNEKTGGETRLAAAQ